MLLHDEACLDYYICLVIVCHILVQDTHMNESSYVVKVDVSTVGYGNQFGLCMLYKLSGPRRSKSVVTTLCKVVK